MLDISTLRSKLRRHLGVDPTDTNFDNSWCDLQLNQSWWEIQDKFKFKQKEGRTTLSFLAGSYTQALSPSTLEAIRSVYVVDPHTQEHKQLHRLTSETFENNSVFDPTLNKGIPESYYRENGTLYIYPVPDQTYSVILLYQGTLSDLSDSNTTAPIPQSWHEIILYGAVYRSMLELKDIEGANTFRGLQNDLMATAIPVETKEEFDSRFAGLYVYGYEDY